MSFYLNQFVVDPNDVGQSFIDLSAWGYNDGNDGTYVHSYALPGSPVDGYGAYTQPITMWTTWGPVAGITLTSDPRTIRVSVRVKATQRIQDPTQTAPATGLHFHVMANDDSGFSPVSSGATPMTADDTWQDVQFTFVWNPAVVHANGDGDFPVRFSMEWPYAETVDVSELLVEVSTVTVGVIDLNGIKGVGYPDGRSGQRVVFMMSGLDDPAAPAGTVVGIGGSGTGGGSGTTDPTGGGSTGTTTSSGSSSTTVTDTPTVQDLGYLAVVIT